MFFGRNRNSKGKKPVPVPENKVPLPPRRQKLPDTSKNRRFTVGHTLNNLTGEHTSFFVTDCFDDEELQSGRRPSMVSFPVSQLYDAHSQKRRAEKYAEYLNRLAEAAEQAARDNLLIDLIKGDE